MQDKVVTDMKTLRKEARHPSGTNPKSQAKKRKSHKVCFSISEHDYKKYSRLCQYEGIHFKQLIKKALREYFEQSDMRSWEEVPEDQLDIFTQIDLFGQPVLPDFPPYGKTGGKVPRKTENQKRKTTETSPCTPLS